MYEDMLSQEICKEKVDAIEYRAIRNGHAWFWKRWWVFMVPDWRLCVLYLPLLFNGLSNVYNLVFEYSQLNYFYSIISGSVLGRKFQRNSSHLNANVICFSFIHAFHFGFNVIYLLQRYSGHSLICWLISMPSAPRIPSHCIYLFKRVAPPFNSSP